jgi:hypothetical protein
MNYLYINISVDRDRAFSYDGGFKLYDLVYGVIYSYLQIEQTLHRYLTVYIISRREHPPKRGYR